MKFKRYSSSKGWADRSKNSRDRAVSPGRSAAAFWSNSNSNPWALGSEWFSPTNNTFLEFIYSPFLLSVQNSIAEQVFHHVFPNNLLVVDKLLQCKLELRKNVWIRQPSENESLTLVGLKMISSFALSPDTYTNELIDTQKE